MVESIELEDGKYKVILRNGNDEGYCFHAERFGESWRYLTGDKLILAMFNRIKELENTIENMNNNAWERDTYN